MSALTLATLLNALAKLRATPLVGIVCHSEREPRLRKALREAEPTTGTQNLFHTPIEVCVKDDQEEPFRLFYNQAEMRRYLAGKTLKYILVPGHVRSLRTGVRHWVSSHALPWLYGVDPLECIAYPAGAPIPPEHRDLPLLVPRSDGIYKLPEYL